MGRHSIENPNEAREMLEEFVVNALHNPVSSSRVARRRAEQAKAQPVPEAHMPVSETPSESGMVSETSASSLMEGVQMTGVKTAFSSSPRYKKSFIVAAAAAGMAAVGAGAIPSSVYNDGAHSLAALAYDAASDDALGEASGAAVTFTVTVDGKERSVKTSALTVAEALKDAGIILGEDDRVSTALASPVLEGMTVEIVRVEVRTEDVEEVLQYETVKEDDPSSLKGTETVVQQGSNGLVRNSYRVVYENGVEVSRELLVSVEIAPATNQLVKVGTKAPSAGEAVPSGRAVPAGEAQQIAHAKVLARGWGEDQFTCLVTLWNRESGWRSNASNPYSGAYGIPQALPGSKMASAGADWRTNPATQIEWGLGYIAGRYGTPCGALGHSNRVGWY